MRYFLLLLRLLIPNHDRGVAHIESLTVKKASTLVVAMQSILANLSCYILLWDIPDLLLLFLLPAIRTRGGSKAWRGPSEKKVEGGHNRNSHTVRSKSKSGNLGNTEASFGGRNKHYTKEKQDASHS